MSTAFKLPHAGTLQRVNRTPQAVNTAVLGVTVPTKLTVNGLIKYIKLRLTGTMTVATAAQINFSESPLGLLRRIDFVTADNTVLMSFTGEQLYALNRYMRGKASERVPPVSGTGTRTFSATLYLDQEAIRFLDPSESLHDPSRWKDIYVNITWGQVTDICLPNGGTDTITAAQVAITVVQTMEGLGQIEFDHIHNFVEIPITASNQNLVTDVPGIGSLAGFLIQTRRDAGTAGPVPVNDIVNNVTFVSGGVAYHVNREPWTELQTDNVSIFQLDGASVLGNPIDGYAYVRLDDNWQFASLYNVRAMNKPQVILDVTRTSGTEVVRILWDFFRLHPLALERMAAGAA